MRDHGGDLDRAMKIHGGDGWLDLSTGINPVPYPLPDLAPAVWNTLPTRSALAALEAQAAQTYATQAQITALSGAQAAIQLVPRLAQPGRACVVGPTYNEHAAALQAQGWTVEQVLDPDEAQGAALAVVVNPNNPDGRSWTPSDLLALAPKVGMLIVDESFADPTPDLSLAPHLSDPQSNIIVLRSFGKFYGLAGVRLGFALCAPSWTKTLKGLAGPWAVNGPAIAAGNAALQDDAWKKQTIARLAQDAQRMDALAHKAGWSLVGGTTLFRTYNTGDAPAAQEHLAKGRVWSRIFPYSASWLRLGLPGTPDTWVQLEAALRT